LIVGGMITQAAALGMVAFGHSFGVWLAAAILLGVGTAMVYPTLLAAIGDVAHPEWRARSVGIYRLWRDGGFAVGAMLSGVLADAFGIPAAVGVVGALTAASGLVVAARMRGTDHPSGAATDRVERRVSANPMPSWRRAPVVVAQPDDESFGLGAAQATFVGIRP
jgi:Major Facilitator Superfamily.